MLHQQKEDAKRIRRELKISAAFFAAGMPVMGALLKGSGWLVQLPCEKLLCALLGGTILGGWCVCWRWFSSLVYRGMTPDAGSATIYYVILIAGGPLAFWPSVIFRLWKIRRMREEEDPWHTKT
ncbi:MAG: hypothetical protein IJ507_09510 [Clostridia bacterium]|nr:hypothetical protein [Clostridia bacterium]